MSPKAWNWALLKGHHRQAKKVGGEGVDGGPSAGVGFTWGGRKYNDPAKS